MCSIMCNIIRNDGGIAASLVACVQHTSIEVYYNTTLKWKLNKAVDLGADHCYSSVPHQPLPPFWGVTEFQPG